MINLKTCPTCGSRRLRRVRRTVVRVCRGERYSVPNLSFYECPDCGEQVYGPEAMERIERHRRRLAKTGRVGAD